MKPILFAAALALSTPTLAQNAADTLSIQPGETVTVRVADNRFVELSRTSGEAQGERAADTIRFSFSGMGGMLMLHVENGYSQAFNYRARMTLGSRSARTSTCTVLPRIAAFESWPHRIDRLELSQPRLSDTPEMACRE